MPSPTFDAVHRAERDRIVQLAAEAIGFGAQATAGMIEHILSSSDDIIDAVDALVELFGRRLAESDWHLGCALATATLETATIDEQLADACRNGFDAWVDRLRRRLAAAGVPQPSATDLAMLILATIEGGLILARAHRSPEPLERIRREIPSLLRDRLPATQ